MPDDDEGANETSRPENQQEDVLRTLYLVCLEEYGTLLEHAPDDDDVGDDGDAGDGNGNSSSFGDRLETEAVRFEVWDEEAGVTAGRLGGLKHDSLYASLTSGLQRISCLLEVLGRLLNVSSQNVAQIRSESTYSRRYFRAISTALSDMEILLRILRLENDYLEASTKAVQMAEGSNGPLAPLFAAINEFCPVGHADTALQGPDLFSAHLPLSLESPFLPIAYIQPSEHEHPDWQATGESGDVFGDINSDQSSKEDEPALQTPPSRIPSPLLQLPQTPSQAVEKTHGDVEADEEDEEIDEIPTRFREGLVHNRPPLDQYLFMFFHAFGPSRWEEFRASTPGGMALKYARVLNTAQSTTAVKVGRRPTSGRRRRRSLSSRTLPHISRSISERSGLQVQARGGARRRSSLTDHDQLVDFLDALNLEFPAPKHESRHAVAVTLSDDVEERFPGVSRNLQLALIEEELPGICLPDPGAVLQRSSAY